MTEADNLEQLAEHDPKTARLELASLIKEHYGLRDEKNITEITKTEFLPKYKILEGLLKEKGEWYERRDEIVDFLCETLNCTKKEAENYIKFYDEVTQTE